MPPSCATAACAASTSRSTRSIPTKFRAITRWGDLDKVLAGIEAAQAAGLAVKINAVALKGVNEDEIPALIAMGARPRHGSDADRGDADRRNRRRPPRPISAAVAGARAAGRALHARPISTIAPAARRVMCASAETGGRLGFITPMTHNFCEVLQSRAHHLHRHALYVPRPGGCRRSAQAAARLRRQRSAAAPRSTTRSRRKPKGHDFIIDRRHQPAGVSRHMSVTGG